MAYTMKEWEERINKKGDGRYEFVSWVYDYKNSQPKAIARCKVDGYEWAARPNYLCNDGYGCKKCSVKNRTLSVDKRIVQINSIENIEFVSWVNKYKNAHSKAVVRCKIDNFEWEASVHHIVNGGHGCPLCAKYGFQLDKKGTMYALLSDCGNIVKVGISNNPENRHRKLAKSTPFKFSVIEQIHGHGEKIAELERYFHKKYKSAGLSGFDGATEWLICTDELLNELRTIKV